MAVDKAAIISYLDEIGFDDETRAKLLDQLERDEAKAAKFVGQRLRFDDYTRKTQSLAQEKSTIDRQVAQQVGQYAQQLNEAQARIDTILKQYEEASISSATANARLERVKQHFGLTDDDVPPVQPSPGQPTSSQQPTLDIDAKVAEKFTELKAGLMRELLPELMAFPRISAQQLNLAERHRTLLGKGISDEEWVELLKSAEEKRQPLVRVWQEKYDIANVEKEREFQGRLDTAKQKWEDEEARKRSEAAIASAAPHRDSPATFGGSPVIGKKFTTTADPAAPGGSNGQSPATPGKPGWQRAAEKWADRRAQGVPLGAPPAAKR